MNSLATAVAFLGATCMLAGHTAAAVIRTATLTRAGAPQPGGRPAAPSGVDLAWLTRLSPAGGAVLGWVMAAGPGAVAGVVAGVLLPWMWRRRHAASRAALLEDQLAEAVSSLAAGLRAGLSLSRAIAFTADESDPPLASSLAAVADRSELGVPLERALGDWAAGTGSADARLLAGVLDLHRRTGGELPVVLDGVAATLRERRAAAREVRALTAQARLSGAILGLLPIGFFLFLSLTARDDISAAFHSPAGIAAMALGSVMQGLAFIWIRSLLRVDG